MPRGLTRRSGTGSAARESPILQSSETTMVLPDLEPSISGSCRSGRSSRLPPAAPGGSNPWPNCPRTTRSGSSVGMPSRPPSRWPRASRTARPPRPMSRSLKRSTRAGPPRGPSSATPSAVAAVAETAHAAACAWHLIDSQVPEKDEPRESRTPEARSSSARSPSSRPTSPPWMPSPLPPKPSGPSATTTNSSWPRPSTTTRNCST